MDFRRRVRPSEEQNRLCTETLERYPAIPIPSLPKDLVTPPSCSTTSCTRPNDPLPALGSSLYDETANDAASSFSSVAVTRFVEVGMSKLQDVIKEDRMVEKVLDELVTDGISPQQLVDALLDQTTADFLVIAIRDLLRGQGQGGGARYVPWANESLFTSIAQVVLFSSEERTSGGSESDLPERFCLHQLFDDMPATETQPNPPKIRQVAVPHALSVRNSKKPLATATLSFGDTVVAHITALVDQDALKAEEWSGDWQEIIKEGSKRFDDDLNKSALSALRGAKFTSHFKTFFRSGIDPLALFGQAHKYLAADHYPPGAQDEAMASITAFLKVASTRELAETLLESQQQAKLRVETRVTSTEGIPDTYPSPPIGWQMPPVFSCTCDEPPSPSPSTLSALDSFLFDTFVLAFKIHHTHNMRCQFLDLARTGNVAGFLGIVESLGPDFVHMMQSKLLWDLLFQGQTSSSPFGHSGAHVYLWTWAVKEVCYELDLLAEGPVCLCLLLNDPSLLLRVHSIFKKRLAAIESKPLTFIHPHYNPLPLVDHVEKAIADGRLQHDFWKRRIDYRPFLEVCAREQWIFSLRRLQKRELNFEEADNLLRTTRWLGGVRSFETGRREITGLEGVKMMFEYRLPLSETADTEDGDFESVARFVKGDEDGFRMCKRTGPGFKKEQMKRRALQYKMQGNHSYSLGRHSEASLSFSLATVLDPSESIYYSNLAAALSQVANTEADYSRVISICCVALAISPNNEKAGYRRAHAYKKLGRDDKAEKDFAKLRKEA